jgi:predicted NUDIX family phosphoesterase
MEKVLVFDTEVLNSIGSFQGFSLDVEKYLSAILDEKNNRFIDRNIAEKNPKYKQIIPYVVIRFHDSVLSYIRGKRVGEKRLAGLRSVAFGGHIEPVDQHIGVSSREAYYLAVERELREEISIETTHTDRIVALINDDSTEVGKVHFGILHIWDLAAPIVSKREQEITKLNFMPLDTVKKVNDELESWSKIALTVLYKGP